MKLKVARGQIAKIILGILRNNLSPLASYETLEKPVTLSQLPIYKVGITFFLLTKSKHKGKMQVEPHSRHRPLVHSNTVADEWCKNFWKHLIAASNQLEKLFLPHLRLVSSGGFLSLLTTGIPAPVLTMVCHDLWNPTLCSNCRVVSRVVFVSQIQAQNRLASG